MIREFMKEVDSVQKKRLLYALEHGISLVVYLSGNKWIGVYVEETSRLKVLEVHNLWSCGETDEKASDRS